MDKYLRHNQRLWDEVTPVHAASPFYDLAGFKAGRTSLHSIELQELGDVSGRRLLHLQCHFGMDTLSWARLGAKVTGVDFSHKAISLARNLSAELEIPARFIESNLYDLPRVLKGKYDIVFTSYGVLCWLPDLTRWAQIAAGYLKRGGTFYIVEGHPVMNILDTAPDSAGNPVSKVTYPYFSSSPTEWPPGNDYADQGFRTRTGSVEWNHPLSEIINALIGAGLRIEFLHEFPVCCYQASPYLHQDPQGWWRMPGDLLPQTFSIKATKR